MYDLLCCGGVVALQDGSRLEMVGMSHWRELKDHIEKCSKQA